MTTNKILRVIVTGILLLTALPGFSQLANTLYFMKGVPQVYHINPSFQPGCKFFIGFPGVSPLQLRIQNQPLSLKDVLYYNDATGQLITFLHPLGSKPDFLDALNKRNFINADIGIPFASVGFGSPAKGWYVAFDISQRISSSANYPRDLMRLLLDGPGLNKNFDFNGLGINVLSYTELSANISKKINDMITVGWRGKILLGQANLSTTKFDVNLVTSEEVWRLNSDITLDATLPFLDVVYDQDGMINFDSTEIMSDIEQNISDLVFNPKNTGLAMDLGVDIRPIDKLYVSASIVDFGSIRWKDKVYNMESNAYYEFRGLEVTLDSIQDPGTIADSLQESFKFSSSNDPYRTWLPTKIYLGASYYVHPKISFGVLSRSEFYKKSLRQQFTFSANLYPIRMLSTTFTYSIIEGSYKNVGLGLALKAFPFNFYIITDTGPSIYFWPADANYLNLRIGMNFMIGCKQKKVQKFDMPLIN